MTTHKKLARTLSGAGIGAGAVGLLAARRRSDRFDFDTEALCTPAVAPDVIPVVTPDGTKLRVHAYGPADGEPIVFSHGWTCSIEYWYPQINALADKYRVIAYDQRGHGESEMGRTKPSIDLLGQDLAAVLDATIAPRKKAVLVGHSMGGMTLMSWAGQFPDQVDKRASAILLANTGADSLIAETHLVPVPAVAAAAKETIGRVVLGAPIPLPGGKISRGIFRNRVMSPTATRDEVEFCQRIVFACKGRARGKWGLAMATLDVAAALEHITVPVTVLAGEADKLTPPAHSERLADALRGYGVLDRTIVLPGVGHMANVEAIDAVNEEVLRLRTLGKRRRPRRKLAIAAS